MTAEIHLQFLDRTKDRVEHVEVKCLTELSNIAYSLLITEKADLANFNLLIDERP